MAALKNETKYEGFTLVELLIAIFIFSIVIVSVYGIYRTTFHTINNSTEELERASSARIAMKRISDDLYGMVIGEGGQITGTTEEFNGQRGDTISLLTSSYLRVARDNVSTGYSIVKIFPEYAEESETYNLYRSSFSDFPGQAPDEIESTRYLLCENVQSITYTYINDDGESEEAWETVEPDAEEDVGDLTENLPSMIYVRLEIKGKTEENNNKSVFTTAVSFFSLKGVSK